MEAHAVDCKQAEAGAKRFNQLNSAELNLQAVSQPSSAFLATEPAHTCVCCRCKLPSWAAVTQVKHPHHAILSTCTAGMQSG